MVLKEFDVTIGAGGLKQGALNLAAGDISGVHNAPVAVAALAVQAQLPVCPPGEVRAQLCQLQHPARAL